MSPLPEDFRYGLRLVKRSPGFAAVTVITLALGIGANTAIFILDALVLRTLPVSQPERLVEIQFPPRPRIRLETPPESQRW